LRVLGELGAQRGDRSGARANFSAALALAEELGMRPLAAHCRDGLGQHEKSTEAFESMRMYKWGGTAGQPLL
jgi:hypothetical protein